ncbi:MAG TPA: choline kinase [Opitutae bacterium]|nr:choline kinase [Opitutae bacterium]
MKDFSDFVLEVTKAQGIGQISEIQSLWSGYGSIKRLQLKGAGAPSLIVKLVSPPSSADHPRGWNTSISHQRKLKSYQVESNWYGQTAMDGSWGDARIPQCYGVHQDGEQVLLVLEDLDAAGFSERRSFVNESQWKSCVRWLAQFHAAGMDVNPQGLWETGTYWHLETRPDELEGLDDLELKKAAHAIDQKLKSAKFQTLVHGDAKLANFCFQPDGDEVAAVDFQYIGRGCGMKDLAYFVGSCFRNEEAEAREEEALDCYFQFFAEAIKSCVSEASAKEVEAEWRPLYRVAWADFHRFMKGWSPGHWKLSDYSERVTRSVIEDLNG